MALRNWSTKLKGLQEFSTSHVKRQFKNTAPNRLQSYGQPFSKVLSAAGQACSTLYMMHDVGNFGKISSANRQHEFQYTV